MAYGFDNTKIPGGTRPTDPKVGLLPPDYTADTAGKFNPTQSSPGNSNLYSQAQLMSFPGAGVQMLTDPATGGQIPLSEYAKKYYGMDLQSDPNASADYGGAVEDAYGTYASPAAASAAALARASIKAGGTGFLPTGPYDSTLAPGAPGGPPPSGMGGGTGGTFDPATGLTKYSSDGLQSSSYSPGAGASDLPPGSDDILSQYGLNTQQLTNKALPGLEDIISKMNTSTGLSPEAMSALRSEATSGIPTAYEQQAQQRRIELLQRGAIGAGELPGSSGDILRAFAPLDQARAQDVAAANRSTIMANEAEKQRTLGINQQRGQEALSQLLTGQGLTNQILGQGFQGQTAMKLATLDSSTKLQLAKMGIDSDEKLALLSSTTQLKIADLDSNTRLSLAKMGIDSDEKLANLQAQTQLTLGNLQSNTQLKLGDLDAATRTTLARLGIDSDEKLANLQSQTQLTLGGMDAATRLEISKADNETQRWMGTLNSETQKTLAQLSSDTQLKLGNLDAATRLKITDIENAPGSLKPLLLSALLGTLTSPGAGGTSSILGKGIGAVIDLFSGKKGNVPIDPEQIAGIAGAVGGGVIGTAGTAGTTGGAGGGAGAAITGLLTNPITIAIGGAIAATVLFLKSQAHHEANTWVQKFQNPFDKQMSDINNQFVALARSGQLTRAQGEQIKESMQNMIDTYMTSLDKFKGQGSDERTVAGQALTTFEKYYGPNGSAVLRFIDDNLQGLA